MEVQLYISKAQDKDLEEEGKYEHNQNLNADLFEDIQEHQGPLNYSFVIKPESSFIIPLKACGFDKAQLRPMLLEPHKQSLQDSKFEWTQIVDISLLQDEREIFEMRPIVLASKMIKNKRIVDRNNNRIFFILNANVYSIRSFIDYNTQQTEFISMKYLSISPPVTIQNLIPSPLTILFKNIERDTPIENQKALKDKQLYDLELKMNSSIQVPYLNPQGNFDISLCIPGFQHSHFIPFKIEGEDDFVECEEKEQETYIRAMFDNIENEGRDEVQQVNLNIRNNFRFMRQKKLLFQLTSKFQNQFNICANVAFIQGFYHITFFAKYWFLNNTQMPLQIQVKNNNFAFEQIDLPFESNDFDFESIQKFIKEANITNADEKANKGRERRLSIDSFQTETVQDGRTNKKSAFSIGQKGESDHVDYKDLYGQLQKSNAYGYGRLKPWESYKAFQNENLGLVSALSNEDINRVSSMYYQEEENKEEDEISPIKYSIKTQLPLTHRISDQEEEKSNKEEFKLNDQFNNQLIERQTMFSKTSIQMVNYLDFIEEQQSVPLIHTFIANSQLYETPLKDTNELKRIVLFSDNPLEEQVYTSQSLKVKICDSEWTQIPFEATKLQGESIFIKDKDRDQGQTSLYEVVTSIQFLPYPFSFSKLVVFQPKYIMVNKTFLPLYIIQAECEEIGIFKVVPQETSVFHWTDSLKPHQISVRLEDYEYSGTFIIDSIGEQNLRLRSSIDRECLIMNTSINEENNTFYIIFSDVSYQPPFRIENLTKTSFKISQVNSRSDDFDMLKPFNILPFAWSYPLNEKLIRIAICQQSQDENLGIFNIDTISKNETITLKDKKNKRDFILEIINEKTMKIIRIINAKNAAQQQKLIPKPVEQKNETTFKIKFMLNRLGLSIVNSQAREIAYVTIRQLAFNYKSSKKNLKMQLKTKFVQIDNQLIRQDDAIILKRQPDTNMDFLSLKFHYVKNESIENLYYFKYFILALVPFDLNLDGNFCDESYKYVLDIFNHSKKLTFQQSHAHQFGMHDDVGEIQEMKLALNEFKKPYQRNQVQGQKKIYFEQFYIQEIKLNFTFSSSPILFREFTMNPTLKFFIMMLSNLKNVQLNFTKYSLTHQHLLLSIFLAQVKRHYLYQCYSHKQFLKIVSSMGIFGNFGKTMNSLSFAFSKLVTEPFRQDNNFFTGLALGTAFFVKESVSAVSGSVASVFDTFKRAVMYIGQSNYQMQQLTTDKDLFEDDIEQASRDLNNFSSPLATIDTQNKIWLKIITREKQNYEVKKRLLKKHIEQQAPQGEAIEVKQEQLNEFFRRQRSANNHVIRRIFKGFYSTIAWGPRKMWALSTKALENLNAQIIEENISSKAAKIRPPRFVSFTMELEPYSQRKAYALEVLNEINLNVFETETIHKIYMFSKNTLISTGKRIICVQEQKSMNSNVSIYKHWNIFFRDILRVSIEVFDKHQNKKVSQEEFREMFSYKNRAYEANSDIRVNMKIFYHEVYNSKDDEEAQNTKEHIIGVGSLNRQKDAILKQKQLQSGFCMDSGLGDLRIAYRSIYSSTKHRELKLLEDLNKNIEMRINQNIIK